MHMNVHVCMCVCICEHVCLLSFVQLLKLHKACEEAVCAVCMYMCLCAPLELKANPIINTGH